MPSQNHVILREIVEVVVPGDSSARTVQATFARVLRDAVLTLLGQRFDELSSPETIHRLDTLEVDLGRLPMNGLEDALTHALATAIPARLDEAMQRAENAAGGQRVTPAASRLELIGHFLRTGTLPWWAGHPGPDAFAESLRLLCRETPPGLLANLCDWVQEPVALARLVRLCDDDHLRRLLAVLRPADAGSLAALPDTLRALPKAWDRALSLPPDQVRREVWQAVLHTAVHASSTERAVLLEDVIQRVGTALQWSPQTLIDARSRVFGHDSRPPATGSTQPAQPGDEPYSPLQGFLAAMDISPARLPSGLRANLPSLLAKSEQSAPGFEDEFGRWLRAALAAGALPPSTLQRWLDHAAVDDSSAARELRTLVAAAMTAPRPGPPAPRAPISVPFNDADALYVDNAGLVILGPFLPTFFARLGLIVEKQFPEEPAQHRAVALLQFLLSPEPEPPTEYLLPLNKVLCGLLPTALFEPGAPVTDEEQAECVQFLTAVIEQAPILRHMSLTGFRGSFLARQGQLSTRDGTWLLRVERETYDVVLDRFPWSFQCVRLPWMNAPLFVEW